ncbi:hypothetical protein DITRI_Ditri06bG0133400 [Diplodiscus trichospermus]
MAKAKLLLSKQMKSRRELRVTNEKEGRQSKRSSSSFEGVISSSAASPIINATDIGEIYVLGENKNSLICFSSSGKQGRKRFPFSSRKIASPGGGPKVVGKKLQRRQWRHQVEQMENQLAKMKEEIRDWNKSLLAAKKEGEAKLELMIATRNELMDNLLEMKVTEAFLMHYIGIL